MHTRDLTGPGEHPATNEDREDKVLAQRFRVSAGVQQYAMERKILRSPKPRHEKLGL